MSFSLIKIGLGGREKLIKSLEKKIKSILLIHNFTDPTLLFQNPEADFSNKISSSVCLVITNVEELPIFFFFFYYPLLISLVFFLTFYFYPLRHSAFFC